MRIYLNREQTPRKIASRCPRTIYVFASVFAQIQKLSYGISVSGIVNALHTPQFLFKTGGQIQYFLIAFTLSSTRSFVYKPEKTSASFAFGYGVYKIER